MVKVGLGKGFSFEFELLVLSREEGFYEVEFNLVEVVFGWIEWMKFELVLRFEMEFFLWW